MIGPLSDMGFEVGIPIAFEIEASAYYDTGVTVTITNFGAGTNSNTFNLYIDFNIGTQQIVAGTTGWTLNTPRTFAWNQFSPSTNRMGGPFKISLLNNNLEALSNEVAIPPTVLEYSVDSVIEGGLYITVNSFDSLYSQFGTIDIAIIDNGPDGNSGTGQNTGTMTKSGLFGATAPTASLFYSWNDLVGYTPTIDPGNWTRITIEDTTAGGSSTSPTIYFTGDGTYFPWPTSGGVPCFVAASNLLTPTGYKSAKDIKTGDLLMTADGRQVPVKTYSFTVEKTDKDSAPFLVPKNSISLGCPNADLKLSPWHAFQMKKGLWMKPMSAFELGMPVKQYDLGKSVTYYHFEAPDYFKDNFVCEGTVVESFGVLQTKSMKGRPYTYNANLKGYTRTATKSVSKAIMM
jgi:hypothetical protein